MLRDPKSSARRLHRHLRRIVRQGALDDRCRNITHRIPLAEIAEAFALLKAKAEEVVKVVIEP